jgi:phage tail-like protein
MKKEEIKRLLPSIFQNTAEPGNPLLAILDVMQKMHEPSEAAISSLEENFDPYRAPDSFVPYLATWVDLEVLLDAARPTDASSTPVPSTGLGRLRELTAAAATLSQWRGTRLGLSLFLKAATGADFDIDEQVLDEDGKPRPFYLRINGPKELEGHRQLIHRIVQLEKPAYVKYELGFSRK